MFIYTALVFYNHPEIIGVTNRSQCPRRHSDKVCMIITSGSNNLIIFKHINNIVLNSIYI